MPNNIPLHRYLVAGIIAGMPILIDRAHASELCEKAIAIGNAITDRYKVSAPMARSFARFARTNCSDIDWEIATPVDQKAFEEFRVRLIVLKKTTGAGTSH